MSLDMNIDNGTVFQHSILRCIGKTIHSLAIISRFVPANNVINVVFIHIQR